MTKDEFIGKYLDRAMEEHGLPYGLAYYNLLAEKTEEAEQQWRRYERRYGTAKVKGNKA